MYTLIAYYDEYPDFHQQSINYHLKSNSALNVFKPPKKETETLIPLFLGPACTLNIITGGQKQYILLNI